jgi:hypothetical protein
MNVAAAAAAIFLLFQGVVAGNCDEDELQQVAAPAAIGSDEEADGRMSLRLGSCTTFDAGSARWRREFQTSIQFVNAGRGSGVIALVLATFRQSVGWPVVSQAANASQGRGTGGQRRSMWNGLSSSSFRDVHRRPKKEDAIFLASPWDLKGHVRGSVVGSKQSAIFTQPNDYAENGLDQFRMRKRNTIRSSSLRVEITLAPIRNMKWKAVGPCTTSAF